MDLLDIGADYPQDWADFIGQEQLKRQVKVACESAKIRGVALPHCLLASGVPGVGKTAIAFLVARTMGTKVHPISGKVTVNDARLVCAGMLEQDILLIDEIHRCVQGGKSNAEWLLHLLQDGVIMGPLGAEPLPEITVIGTTTDAGRLPLTIIERFRLRPVIETYTADEAVEIVRAMAREPFTEVGLKNPTDTNLEAIAQAANHNPRQIKAVVSNLRDLALTKTIKYDAKRGGYDISEALSWLGLSPDGLDRTCQRYLAIMLREFPNGAGERALVDRLQEPGGLGVSERTLMDKGFVVKTRTGRMLTQAGIRRARELAEEAVA